MWAVEGLTHRYPTKVLAEMISTCPQYCGHCTRMDLVGNDTAQVLKYKFELKQNDRWDAMLDYLRSTPQVRDVVVSGGDMANVPARAPPGVAVQADGHREHPRCPDRDEGPDGPAAALPPGRRARRVRGDRRARARTRGGRGRPHARQRRAAGDAARRRRRATPARHGLPRRAQPGRPAPRGQHHAAAAARALLHAPGSREDPPVLLLHVRHDPERRALAAGGLGGAGAPARDPRLPARASRRRASSATCRTSASGGCT